MARATAADRLVSEPASAAPAATPIARVAIIGAGRLGRRLAELCCQAGYSVALEDVLPSRLRGAAREFESIATPPGSAGKIDYATTIEEAVREADLVIDWVPDELESKLEILSLIDRMAPPRAIIATPTSALSIADLASCTYRPERCLALRLAPGLLTLDPSIGLSLEVTATGATDPAVLQAVLSFLANLGFSTEVTRDTAPS